MRIKHQEWAGTDALATAIGKAMQQMNISPPKIFTGFPHPEILCFKVAPQGKKNLFLSRGTDHPSGVRLYTMMDTLHEHTPRVVWHHLVEMAERVTEENNPSMIAIYNGIQASSSLGLYHLNPALPHKGLIGLIMVDLSD